MKKLIILLLCLVYTTTYADNNTQNTPLNNVDYTIQINKLTVDALKNQIKDLEKEIERVSVKEKDDFETYRDQVAWAVGLIGIIVALIGGLLPLLINMRKGNR